MTSTEDDVNWILAYALMFVLAYVPLRMRSPPGDLYHGSQRRSWWGTCMLHSRHHSSRDHGSSYLIDMARESFPGVWRDFTCGEFELRKRFLS